MSKLQHNEFSSELLLMRTNDLCTTTLYGYGAKTIRVKLLKEMRCLEFFIPESQIINNCCKQSFA